MMATRHLVGIVVVVMALVALVGCSSDPEPPATSSGATPAEYVKAVEALLAPAGSLAALASDRLAGRQPRASGAAALVLSAEREIAELNGLVIADTALDAQRVRLVRGFQPVLRSMRVVARHLARNDDTGLAISAPQLFSAIRELPSATSA